MKCQYTRTLEKISNKNYIDRNGDIDISVCNYNKQIFIVLYYFYFNNDR